MSALSAVQQRTKPDTEIDSDSFKPLVIPVEILELADRKVSSFQKWTGRNLDEYGSLGRLLMLRREALAADLECRWKLSDFLWKETLAQLRRLAQAPKVWEVAAGLVHESLTQGKVEPDALKSAFIDQLFIETHLALQKAAVAAWTDKPSPGSREFVYTEFLRQDLNLANATRERQARILVPLVDRWIEANAEAKKWDDAISIIKDMLARVPQERQYRETLMVMEHHKTIGSLTAGRPLTSEDAKRLKQGIAQLEKLRSRYTEVPLVYILIAGQRHLRRLPWRITVSCPRRWSSHKKAWTLLLVTRKHKPRTTGWPRT
jgi:hypothetical protein